jgi:phenylacetate-CoA ligase
MHRWIAWNVFFPLHERLKGHNTFQFLREMEEADSFSASELEELQRHKLRDLIGYAYAHVPYARLRMQQAGVEPAQIHGPEDLARLPLMRKADVRRNREQLRSDIAGKLASFTTGGSTGEPLIFDLAKRRVASRVACRLRTSHWWGVGIGDRELAIWGSVVEVRRQDWVRRVRDFFLASRLLSAFELNEPTITRYLDILESGGCRQIFGYPSAIYLVCLQARKEGRNLRRLGIKVAFVTGEVLFPYQRELISDVLNCPVANGYGGRDSALIAHECPQGGMHILSDAVILELLDAEGRPVRDGESGEIVITDLYSHEAPFIRYATGDMAVMSSRRCPCGRALPLLERVEGRSNDSIVAPDGRIINSLGLIYAIREIEGIERFRICQKAVDTFHVQLVANENLPPDAEQRLLLKWSQLLRSPLRITFEYLPELAVERSGKFRHIVSEVPAELIARK